MRGTLPAVLSAKLWFPDPRKADPHGMVAIGGDLSVERLLLAYRTGLYPWSALPITWWSPDPRAVFELDQFHVPRSLARTLKKKAFEVTVNRAFREVMAACSTEHRNGTWISPEFIKAYTRLHRAGHAHSLECWRDGKLAGGIYGVAVGGMFAGESMFHRVDDGSKVALFHLVERLKERGYELFDVQMTTPITKRLGATELARDEYLARLERAVAKPVAFL